MPDNELSKDVFTADSAKYKKNETDDNKIKIIHKMSDGTVRNSIDGYEIPYNAETSVVYGFLTKRADKEQEKFNTDDKA